MKRTKQLIVLYVIAVLIAQAINVYSFRRELKVFYDERGSVRYDCRHNSRRIFDGKSWKTLTEPKVCGYHLKKEYHDYWLIPIDLRKHNWRFFNANAAKNRVDWVAFVENQIVALVLFLIFMLLFYFLITRSDLLTRTLKKKESGTSNRLEYISRKYTLFIVTAVLFVSALSFLFHAVLTPPDIIASGRWGMSDGVCFSGGRFHEHNSDYGGWIITATRHYMECGQKSSGEDVLYASNIFIDAFLSFTTSAILCFLPFLLFWNIESYIGKRKQIRAPG